MSQRKKKKPPVPKDLRDRLRRWMPPPNRVEKDIKKEKSRRACRGKPEDP